MREETCPRGWSLLARRVRRRLRVRAVTALAGLVVLAGLAGCSAAPGGPGDGSGATRGGSPAPSTAPSTTGSGGSPGPSGTATTLTLGVYGPPAEIDAWRRVAARFSGADVELLTGRTHGALQRRIERSGRNPDVFLTPRDELGRLVPTGVTQPVDELLDARGMDFGDGFSRDALQAFSADDALQCMPWQISPQVVFVNTRLVDFEAMLARDLPVPGSSYSWSLEEFAAAARWASRPVAGIKGVHVPTTLQGLAPLLYSGGGQLFEVAEQGSGSATPTSLSFSSEDSQDALAEVLPVLRDPRLTLSAEERAAKGPVARFADGQLGMLVGDHSLVPRLRAAEGLTFDVRVMPRISETATAGRVTGLCLSASTPDTAAAADLLVHATSTRSVATIVEQGYTVPANLDVLGSEAFTTPGRMPEHDRVFSASLRYQVLGPVVREHRALAREVGPLLRRLVSIQVLDLGGLTHLIDQKSRAVLGPPEGQSTEQPDEDEAAAGAEPQGEAAGAGGS